MQQTTTLRTAQRSFSLKEWRNEKSKSLNLWLDQKSEFYSRICGFPVTRLLAIRVNLVFLCLTISAVAVEQQPVIAVLATLCAAWQVCRLNKQEKGGKS